MNDQRDEKGRFREGVSGNPNGRPKRRKPFHGSSMSNRQSLLRVLEREVDVRTPDGVEPMSIYEASLLALGRKAATGDVQAAKLIMSAGKQAAEDLDRLLDAIEYYKEVIAQKDAELAEWRRRYPQKTHGVLALEPDEWERLKER